MMVLDFLQKRIKAPQYCSRAIPKSVFHVNFIWLNDEYFGQIPSRVASRKSLMQSKVWRRDRENWKKKKRKREESMARINRSAHSPCARLYSCDPIITDRRETITSPCRRAVSVVPRAAECNILLLPGQHWRPANIFQPWSSSQPGRLSRVPDTWNPS